MAKKVLRSKSQIEADAKKYHDEIDLHRQELEKLKEHQDPFELRTALNNWSRGFEDVVSKFPRLGEYIELWREITQKRRSFEALTTTFQAVQKHGWNLAGARDLTHWNLLKDRGEFELYCVALDFHFAYSWTYKWDDDHGDGPTAFPCLVYSEKHGDDSQDYWNHSFVYEQDARMLLAIGKSNKKEDEDEPK